MRWMMLGAAAMATAACQGSVEAQQNWSKPRFEKGPDGFGPTGWKGSGLKGWSPAPGNPAAPLILNVPHSARIDGKTAFAAALRAAGITGMTNGQTFEQSGVKLIRRYENVKSWTSGGTVKIGGVEHAVFARTGFEIDNGRYLTTIFRTPASTVLAWGGAKYYAEGLAADEIFANVKPQAWADVGRAGPAKQAQFFNAVFDGWIVGMVQENIAIQQGTLDLLKGINKDWQTRADCAALARCTYVPGGGPGGGSTRYE